MMKELTFGGFMAIAALMLATGIGVPVLAALNAGLGKSIGSPVTASAIFFTVGCVISVIWAYVFVGAPSMTTLSSAPLATYFAAFFMLFYLVSMTWAAPRIGLGNAVFFVLLGQLISATLIDNYGWFGAIKAEVDLKRIAGLALMAAGVYLARKAA